MRERGNHFLRFLDFFCGIPLVKLCSFVRKKRALPSHFKNIALLKAAGIGDLVLLTGIMETLKEKKLNITLFTGTSNFEMGKLIRGITVIPLPMTRPFSALKTIREREYDVWIDCDPWPRINALLSACSRAHFSIGFRTEGQFRHYLYDCPVPHSFECHEIENYRKLFAAIGLNSSHLPHLERIQKRQQQNRIALHLFPGGSKAHLKVWPEENWKKLIQIILHWGYEIVLTGSEKDRIPLNRYVTHTKIMNVAGSLSLSQTAELLQTCRATVSVDTGIMHLAGALSCRVIGLHGPTSPARWGALGEHITTLTPSLSFTPCINLGFESKCKQNLCMRALTVEQVCDALYKNIR